MKLLYRIIFRLSLALAIILAIWGGLFYTAVIDEVNDEVDDSLEDYSENIITRALAGQPLPSYTDGSNNSYYLKEVSREYTHTLPHIRYSDEMVYIKEKKETEPARVLKTIFKNQQGQYFELTVNTPTIEKEDLQEAIFNWVILLYVSLLFIILSINIWILTDTMKPLYVLLKWLDQYTIGQQDTPPVLKTSITEFRKLNEAAVRSANRNHALFEQQKQFIGNASHELQTPLAICQNRLEMLTEGENLNEEQLTEITKIQETLAYIIRLNKSLLFLSKIENGQFHSPENICINDLLHQQLPDYQEIYSYKKIALTFTEEGTLRVQMNRTLAVALLTNLLKNTYVHNIPEGRIIIHLTPHHLTFSNSGSPEPLDTGKIFQRFFQGSGSGENSSGLGLSITEAICRIHNLRLRYYYSSGLHHFELSF